MELHCLLSSASSSSLLLHIPSFCRPLPSAFCRRRRRVPVTPFASLGFSADPRISVERAANSLLKDAASLLVYQEVLQEQPAQAFLKVLLSLRRGDDAWKLLDAYGEFYRLMAIGCFPSWEDLILEGILVGEGNPFAEALANVGNPRSKWLNGAPPSLQVAAAADLDCLQRLSVAESTLVGWVVDLVPDARPEWRIAAESTLSTRDIKIDWATFEKVDISSDLTSAKLDEQASEDSKFVKDVLTINRETWRKKIGGLWRWSEAVPLLKEYYAQYSIGRIASEQALRSVGGKLIRDTNFYQYGQAYNLSVHSGHRDKLTKLFERHASKGAAYHVLVQGPSGSGKTWLVNSVLHDFVAMGKLRVVTVAKNETKHIRGILEELAKRWQIQYVLVVEGLQIDDVPSMDWPDNVMMSVINLLSSNTAGAKKDPREFNDMVGEVLTLDCLDKQSFICCVDEMLNYSKKLALASPNSTEDKNLNELDSWTNGRVTFTIRSAAQFVRATI